MRIIDADALKYYGNHLGDEYEDKFPYAQWVYRSDIDSAPTIPTKQVKYFDEDEKVWKIGSVIVDE